MPDKRYREGGDSFLKFQVNTMIVKVKSISGILLFLVVFGSKGSSEETFSRFSAHSFGKLSDGREVSAFILKNANGVSVQILDLGGVIASLEVPDSSGNFADVIAGFDYPQPYLDGAGYMGAIVGRFANRISGASFSVDGVNYSLAKNNGNNAIHGGLFGFDKKIWETDYSIGLKDSKLILSTYSPDGEEGYPGRVEVNVTYTLNDQNQLVIDYSATSDKTTIINLTNHAYFNLDGHGAGSILEHEVIINANRFTPIDESSIPTGAILEVVGTPFDFRQRKAIGLEIESEDQQINFGSGYDHNFVIDHSELGDISLAAEVYSPNSGRVMKVYTDQPGVQFYTGNFLNSTLVGKDGAVYGRRSAFCLETQHFPDSPNKPMFPSTTLRPGDRFSSRTVFEFLTE